MNEVVFSGPQHPVLSTLPPALGREGQGPVSVPRGGGGRAGAQLGSSVVPPLQPFFFPGPPFRELWTLGFICPPAFSLRLSCVLVDFCYLTIHLLNILLLLPYFKSVITSLIFFFKSASSGFKKSLFNILEPSFLPFPGYLCLQ